MDAFGENLLRYDKNQRFLLFDFETTDLNLYSAKPWQLSWTVFDSQGIHEERDYFLHWNDLKMSAGAAAVTRFDFNSYKSKAVDPSPVLNEFIAAISNPKLVIVGHNILGFDIYIYNTFRRLLGKSPDYSFLSRCLDTNLLSKCFKKGFKIPETWAELMPFQVRVSNFRERGLKTSLQVMLKEFGIDHAEGGLHDAAYDKNVNMEVFKKLVWALEIPRMRDDPLNIFPEPTLCKPGDVFSLPNDLEIIDRGVKLPKFATSSEQLERHKIGKFSNNADLLRQLCRAGYKNKIGNTIPQQERINYADRINYELSVIEKLGFVDYILIIWDICDYCDLNGIPRGFGRGSVAGSLVSYFLDLTAVNPLEFDLYFERFLSKVRAKSRIIDGETYIQGDLAPDIDFECCYLSRPRVLQYISEKYSGNTCSLLNINTLSSRILIKDILKVNENANESDAMEASSMLREEFGIPEEMDAAMETNEEFKSWSQSHQNSVEIALKLAGLSRSKSQHASAVLVSAENIDGLIPLELSKDKNLISGIDMHSSTSLVLKLDVLGLKCLTTLHETCSLAGIDYRKIDYNHPSIYKFLQSFDFGYGVFQLESEAQGKVAKRIRPQNIWQLADCLSISRPGACQFLEKYCDYIHNGVYQEIHPLVDSVLKRTGGICCYQEQLLKMLNNLGMPLDECEGLRKAIGKKLKDKIDEYKSKIYEVCRLNNHPPSLADLIWKIAQDSAGYQFNAAHAFSYAVLAACTIYVKIHHPLYFFLANLKMARNESESHEIIKRIKGEMPYFGIQMLPPDIFKSGCDFSIEGNDIRFGLASIKGISGKTLEKMGLFKRDYASKIDVFETTKQAGLTIAQLCSLIRCGCLPGVGSQRSRVVLEAQTYNLLTEREKPFIKSVMKEANDDVLSALLLLKSKNNESGKPIIRESRFQNLIRNYEPYKQQFLKNRKNERFANYFNENFYLGYSFSETLREIFMEKMPNLWNIMELQQESFASGVKVVGHVEMTRYGKTRNKGIRYFKFRLSDESGAQDFYCYEEIIDSFRAHTPRRAPMVGDYVLIECNIRNGRPFVSELSIVEIPQYD